MSKVFVVVGNTGEYSDRTDWYVVAYRTEELAQAHVELAKKWYLENGGRELYKPSWGNRDKIKNPFDPNMQVDYTGTDWTVVEVELRDELPK
jgi:hypothetical protein